MQCLLCQSDMRYDGKQAIRQPTEWYLCEECGFSQVHPMPDMDEYYSGDGYRGEVGDASPERELRRLTDWLDMFDPTCKTYLDVGASTGATVAFMRDRMDVAHGVEPGTLGREWGALTTLPEESYDLITCFHVLEHITDPLRFVLTLLGMTNKQLAIEVPDGHKRFWPHVGDYTMESLDRLIGRIGRLEPSSYLVFSDGEDIRCLINVSS